MRKLLSFAIIFSFLQFSYAGSNNHLSCLSQTGVAGLIVQPLVKLVPSTAAQKKMTLKERLLLKWYKKKMNHTVSEEKQKKNVKLLGYLSLGASILAPVLSISLFAISAYGVVQVLSVFALLLIPTAIILGIISLLKRKKLADKTGTSKIPALVGISIASLFAILIIIIAASISINGFE